MSRVLVTYSTNAGSTADVAKSVADEIKLAGHEVDVMRTSEVTDLGKYETVVVGAPMILGWHGAAKMFVRRHQDELAAKKTAYFACAMRLTKADGERLPEFSLALDPNLAEEPAKPGSLSLKERFTTIGHYLGPMAGAAPKVKPLSVAFFKGKLEMFRLKWYQALFVMIVVQAVPGDYRDWEYIKTWAGELSAKL